MKVTAVTTESRSATRKTAWGIMIFLTGFFLLLSGGHIYVRDGGAMFFMTSSLVNHGWFDVPLNPNTGGGKIGPDGRYYMPFGILQPLLAIPFYAIGRVLIPWADAMYIPAMTITWFNGVATAGIAVQLFLFLIDLQVSRNRALLFSIASVLSTPFWVYSRSFFAEPLTSWGLLAAAHALFRYQSTGRMTHVIIAGCLSAATVLIRPLSGTAFPALFLYLLLIENNQQHTQSKKRQLVSILVFILLILAGVILAVLYNYIRFGGVFETGYDYLPDGRLRNFTRDPLSGLMILLFSPGKSIFIFAPLTLLALCGIFFWRKANRPEQVLTVVLPGLFLAVLCRWGEVEGGVTWGPRLLLPAVPIFLLSATPVLRFKRNTAIVMMLVLTSAGLFVQFLGISVNYSTFIGQNITQYFDPISGSYQFSFNPFPGHFDRMVQNLKTAPSLERLPEDVGRMHRSLVQINYAEDLDLWFIHQYRDGVPASFIVTLILCQTALCAAGLLLIGYRIHLKNDPT